MPNPHRVFGGEPIASPDGESLEGVGKTRLTTGTIFTDKLFTGQREMRRPELVVEPVEILSNFYSS